MLLIRLPCALAALVACALLAPPGALAQSGWARTYGGPGTGEGIQAAGKSATGDLVIAATTDSFGTRTGDGWLIHLDAAGNVLSQSVVGNALPGGVDGATITDDGGAVFASRNVRDFFLVHDASLTRVAADGSPLWTTDISADPGRFFVNDVIAASDGTFVGVGQASMSDAGPFVGWILRLDAGGSVAWQQYHGGVIGTDLSFDAGIETSDGGFAVTGWMSTASGQDLFVAKLASNGSLTWAETLGGADQEQGAGIVELPGGGYAVAGSTNSFTSASHAGWVVRLDAGGRLLWNAVLGDGEWSDLEALTVSSDGNLVVLGRIGEPGFPTNDLWALKLDAAAGAILWQHAYEGASGDYANDVAVLSASELLLAGTSGWGFPEEDLWLLRTDGDGLIPGCPLIRDTSVTAAAATVRASPQFLPPYPPFGAASTGSVVTDTTSLTSATQCEVTACPPLQCTVITATPDPACEGTAITLELSTLDGTPPVTVRWDVDGDTVPDLPGNPVVTTLPVGTTTVTAFATDSCAPVASTCQLARDVRVLSAAPPGEVSDVRGGAVPLLVLDHGARLSFEERGDATAYSLYAGALGSWYSVSAAAGSACFVATTPGGTGRLETMPALAAGTWLVVTASSACAEGTAGRDSFGANRILAGSFAACGPAP